MSRAILPLGLLLLALPALAAQPEAESIDKRFQSQDASEVPKFRRHVSPLLGKLGCNGRACHGSFQGRGGFRLSLFGYDFDADHKALLDGRVDSNDVDSSLIIAKPTSDDEHEGGLRYEIGSWQHRVIRNWIKGGANGLQEEDPEFVRLEVDPSEIVFDRSESKPTAQVQVTAVWSDGTREDVTPLCRFESNDDTVAQISDHGLVTGGKPGDTHVVVFYDNGVAPIPVIRPVSSQAGEKYPHVPTPTRIDELVVKKLRKLGVVPSELASDAEFLRRVSLDVTGSLPSPSEVEAFLANTSSNKRSEKIDELLTRPTYTAWWTQRLCDWTGNNSSSLFRATVRGNATASRDWYEWINRRVAENTPYDVLVEGIVLARSRNTGESFYEYSKAMSELYGPDSKGSFADRETMPYFWTRENFHENNDRVIGFSYSFLGIRLQCAQCHKHPFDQWTNTDFKAFQGFFSGTHLGARPDTRDEHVAMAAKLGVDVDSANDRKFDAMRPQLLDEGKIIPFEEFFVVEFNANNAVKSEMKRLRKEIEKLKGHEEEGKLIQELQAKLKALQGKIIANRGGRPKRLESATLLGDARVDLTKYDDPRQPLMDWLRDKDNPYFARAFVNRVWAAYFGIGIVDPPDDFNLANPPSNRALLDDLSERFIASGYDMKWLHRQIANSRTYQLTWTPNETNRRDLRNFSHSVPRRLSAEIAYDAIHQAVSSDAEIAAAQDAPSRRAISIPVAGGQKFMTNREDFYVLSIFGRSNRNMNCDCDRSSKASLLQTIYLRNDEQVMALLENSGWLKQVAESQLEHAQIVKSAYLRTLSRLPDDYELKRSCEYLANASDRTTGAKDLLWSLMNTKEFIVNH